MNSPFLLFWAALVFGSIAWYAFLVVYVGIKAGREIGALKRGLDHAQRGDENSSPAARE